MHISFRNVSYAGLLSKAIPLQLFLGIVPSSSANVTRVLRGCFRGGSVTLRFKAKQYLQICGDAFFGILTTELKADRCLEKRVQSKRMLKHKLSNQTNRCAVTDRRLFRKMQFKQQRQQSQRVTSIKKQQQQQNTNKGVSIPVFWTIPSIFN